MATINSLSVSQALPILCFYINSTNEIQIARLNSNDSDFEKIVFPGERILFEALPDAELEIHTGMNGQESLVKKISCVELIVKEESEIIAEYSSV